ncbi:hypothetical protein ACFQRB_18755 [Halobaculum litoreum]|uniref:Uncharacterized protein n=1 Tax=Halobaculum litoreum TaxID=3031998 RepID=A0ABD5XVL1_9EURY
MTDATTRRIRVAVDAEGTGSRFAAGFRSFVEGADRGLDVVAATGPDAGADHGRDDPVDCVVFLGGDAVRDGQETTDSRERRRTERGVPVVAVNDDGAAVGGADAVVVADATEEGTGASRPTSGRPSRAVEARPSATPQGRGSTRRSSSRSTTRCTRSAPTGRSCT